MAQLPGVVGVGVVEGPVTYANQKERKHNCHIHNFGWLSQKICLNHFNRRDNGGIRRLDLCPDQNLHRLPVKHYTHRGKPLVLFFSDEHQDSREKKN